MSFQIHASLQYEVYERSTVLLSIHALCASNQKLTDEEIDYIYGTTNVETSAFDTVTQRAGVCRDFAHLGIAFCRALSIPARYFTGYACRMQPQDFHACFEACIDNRWFVFDPTRLAPLNGLVRIATGRDAADASVATIFGRMDLTRMTVSCVSEDFQPLGADDLAGHAICIEA